MAKVGLLNMGSEDSTEFLQALLAQMDAGTVDDTLLAKLDALTSEQRGQLAEMLEQQEKSKLGD